MNVLQRPDWPAYSVDLGEGFRLHKDRCRLQLQAVCCLRSHPSDGSWCST